MNVEVDSVSPIRCSATLNDARANKGTAFTSGERERLGLSGLLPHAVETLHRQAERVLGHLEQEPTDLECYVYLTGLLDRNETLFYRVVMSDPARFLTIVYDPTVGEACLKFGHLYRRSRGLYVSLDMKGNVAETRIAEYLFDQDLATAERPREIRTWIEVMLYKPEYGREV